jgi:hypothetical protein
LKRILQFAPQFIGLVVEALRHQDDVHDIPGTARAQVGFALQNLAHDELESHAPLVSVYLAALDWLMWK